MESRASASVVRILPSLPAAPAASTSPSRTRPINWVAWAVVGGLGTYADKIHQVGGVSAYPNSEWIGERLPVSPIYVGAGVGFFALYTLLVTRPAQGRGILGGRPLSIFEICTAVLELLAAYALTAILAGSGRPVTGAIVAAALLAATAAPWLWQARRTRLPLYALCVVLFGVSFEWFATAHGAFIYPVCPSAACAGATVPLMWLPLLYVHVARFFDRLAAAPAG